jgi:hypothetical protein
MRVSRLCRDFQLEAMYKIYENRRIATISRLIFDLDIS